MDGVSVRTWEGSWRVGQKFLFLMNGSEKLVSIIIDWNFFSYQFFEFILHSIDPGLFLCKRPLGPQTLFFISRPVDPLWPFGPTKLIFHSIFSSACYVPLTQVRSHTSVHWTLIIPSIVPSLFDFISSTGPNLSNYVHWVLLMPYSLNSIHKSLINSPHLIPFHRSCFIQPSELCIAYVILSDRSYFMQLIR